MGVQDLVCAYCRKPLSEPVIMDDWSGKGPKWYHEACKKKEQKELEKMFAPLRKMAGGK